MNACTIWCTDARSDGLPYLLIMLVVAVAGVIRLYLMHRRERSQVSTIDGFRSNLEGIGSHTTPRRPVAMTRPEARPRAKRTTSAERAIRRNHPGQYRRHAPLDPERRAAAKRRLEARRRGSARIA